MAIVLTICNTKGGTAKSYVAAQFVLTLHESGVSVALVDADHDQATTSKWVRAAEPDIPIVVTGVPKDIKSEIRRLSQFVDVVIVDTPGSSSGASFASTLIADIAIIPLQPSETDVDALDKSLEAIGIAHEATEGKKPEAFIVLTQTGTVDAYADTLRAELTANLPYTVAKSEIRHYRDLRKAKGKFLSKMKGYGARMAEADAKALVHEVLGRKLPGIKPPKIMPRLKRAANE